MSAFSVLQNRKEAYDSGYAIYMEKWGAIMPQKLEQTHSVWIGPREFGA